MSLVLLSISLGGRFPNSFLGAASPLLPAFTHLSASSTPMGPCTMESGGFLGEDEGTGNRAAWV